MMPDPATMELYFSISINTESMIPSIKALIDAGKFGRMGKKEKQNKTGDKKSRNRACLIGLKY